MRKTEYKIDNQSVNYDIEEDGYTIYLDTNPWITQKYPNIPYPELSLEGSCLKQIVEIVEEQANSEPDHEQEQESTPTPEPTQLDRIEETVSSTALTTEYMACLQEINSETV